MNRVAWLPVFVIAAFFVVVVSLVFWSCGSHTAPESTTKFVPAKGDIPLGTEPTPTPSPTPTPFVAPAQTPTPTPTPTPKPYSCDDPCQEYKRRLNSDIEIHRDYDLISNYGGNGDTVIIPSRVDQQPVQSGNWHIQPDDSNPTTTANIPSAARAAGVSSEAMSAGAAPGPR